MTASSFRGGSTIPHSMVLSQTSFVGSVPVKITGTNVVDGVLTAVPASGYSNLTYQWLSNSTPISGATSSTYTVGAAYANTEITCAVSGTYSVSAGTSRPRPPDAPTIGTLTAASSAVSQAFSAPASNGGAAITNYQLSVYRASDDALLGQANGSASPIPLAGLTNGVAVYGKVAAQNSAGAGVQSAASNTVTPSAAPVSDIQYPEKIPALLAAMKASNTRRVNIAYHGMSISASAGTVGPTALDWADVAWATLGMVPKISAAINTARGGTFKRGVEPVALLNGTGSGNPFFSLISGATLTTKDSGAAGTCGQAISLVGGSGSSVNINIVNGVAGQVVKVYAYTSGGAGASSVIPQYSLAGANVQALGPLPQQTNANPISDLGYYWYETTITLANAGNTAVKIAAAVASGGNLNVYQADPDYTTSVAGLTLHRVSQAGETLRTLIGRSLDTTDTQPAGTFWVTGGASRPKFWDAQTDSVTLKIGAEGVIGGTDINEILNYANNPGAYGYGDTLAGLTRHLQNYVAAMAARGLQVLFVLGPLRAPDTPAITTPNSTPYTQTDIINVYKAVAAASTNAAVLDMTTQFRAGGAATEAQAFANQTADTSRWLASEAPRYVHPSAAGHAFYGNYVSTQIIAAMG